MRQVINFQISEKFNRTLEALYAIESNQHNSQDSDGSNGSFGSDHGERRAIRKISATEEIPNEVKNWLTETFIRGNVIKNLGKFGSKTFSVQKSGLWVSQHGIS